MGDVVCEGMIIVWCGVPSGGSQGHISWLTVTVIMENDWSLSNCGRGEWFLKWAITLTVVWPQG